MTPRRYLLLGTLVLGLAATYALVQSSRPAPERAATPRRPLTCRFTAGEQLAFHVRATSSAHAAQTGSPQQLSLEATLGWRVLEKRPSAGWVMAAALTDVRLLEGGAAAGDPERRAALESPFLIQVDRNCRFHDFAFDSMVDTEARRQIQGLLQAAEIILPPLRRSQWVARHRDSLGAFDASYTLDDSNEEALLLSRDHGRYLPSSLPRLPPQLGGRMRVDVLSSDTRATLDPQGRWVRQLDGAEQVRVWMGSKLLSEVASTVQVERLDGSTGAPAAVAHLDLSRFSWGAATAARRDEPGLPPAPEPALAALDLDGALADFARRIPEGAGNQGVHDATERLASYLSVHPEATAELVARIRAGTVPERLHAMLFLALEKTGTLAAESALASALGDRVQSTMNRMRAAAALQDVPRPTEHTAQILVDQTRASRASPEERQVADASLLALGALSHRTSERQPEVSRLAHTELELRLRGASEPEDVAVALDAIGNSGDERFADTLRPYMQDASPVVRAYAARAWRRMEPGTEDPALAGWLLEETDARVRRALADSLAERTFEEGAVVSSAVLNAAATRLAVEPDARTRQALIALLGSAAGVDASARLALVQQFKRETVPELQVLIGRYVRAEELR